MCLAIIKTCRQRQRNLDHRPWGWPPSGRSSRYESAIQELAWSNRCLDCALPQWQREYSKPETIGRKWRMPRLCSSVPNRRRKPCLPSSCHRGSSKRLFPAHRRAKGGSRLRLPWVVSLAAREVSPPIRLDWSAGNWPRLLAAVARVAANPVRQNHCAFASALYKSDSFANSFASPAVKEVYNYATALKSGYQSVKKSGLLTIRTKHFAEMVQLKPVFMEVCKDFGIAA